MGNEICCNNNSQSQMSNLNSKQTFTICECQQNGYSIAVTQGLIKTENVDTFVVITNRKLKPIQIQDKKLSENVGENVKQEINQILEKEGGKLRHGQVVYTEAGNLKVKYLFYAVIPSFTDVSILVGMTNDQQIQESQMLDSKLKQNIMSIYNDEEETTDQRKEKKAIFNSISRALKLAETLQLKSIAFPIMQSPNSTLSKSLVSTLMLVTIKNYILKNERKSLQNITITTQDPTSMLLFKFNFQKIMIENFNSNMNSEQNINDGFKISPKPSTLSAFSPEKASPKKSYNQEKY